MFQSLRRVTRHEDYFIQRYQWLMTRALHLTKFDSEQAEDLVHDAFIQFTVKSPDLAEIENADAYLNRMLRNMHLSNVRRSNLNRDLSISIAAYDSAEIGLRVTDPRDQIKVQDDLRQICHYACARKESSKAASTFILRFFHSYYPSEIAQILRRPQRPVYDWLKIGRREARLYLEDPDSLKLITNHPHVKTQNFGQICTTADLLHELRRTIFSSRHGRCMPVKDLHNLYCEEDGAIDCATVAHMVSCPVCLEEVNRLLGLPALSERFLTDRLGRDKRPPDDSGGSGPGLTSTTRRKYERRLKEFGEHRPQELRILANGFLLGSQAVTAERNEQSLSIKIDEPVGFIEVFSEQWVRLLFFEVEQPVHGSVEQQTSAEFNGGRTLTLNLSFRGTWPVLHVLYREPLLDSAGSSSASNEDVVATESEANVSACDTLGVAQESRWRSLRRLWSTLRATGSSFFARPATVTALAALILSSVAILVMLSRYAAVPTAADLLAHSSSREEAAATGIDTVVHRILDLEIRNSSSGTLISRQKVESWQSVAKGLRACRLYNERNELIAGEWQRADGSRLVFNHGGKLQPAPSHSAGITIETAWRMIPSATEFSALINEVGRIRVEETPNAYVIRYHAGDQNRVADQPLEASLVLNKPDLHAVEQLFVLRDNAATPQVFEFRFVETSFERRLSSSVAPAVFEPDPTLLARDEASRIKGAGGPVSSNALSHTASAELEIEVLQRLNQVDALLGEQISARRTPEGPLQIEGVLETDQRKMEILRALNSFKGNPAVRVDVVTVAEALKRQRQTANGPVDVTNVEVSRKSLALDRELRDYFSERGLSSEALSEAIRHFSETVLRHSFEARRHALAVKQLAERFSDAELQNLDPRSRDTWRSIIGEHARAIAQETNALMRELKTVVPDLSASDDAGEIVNDADLVRAASRLFGLAVTNDEGVRRSFSLYADNPGNAPVKTVQFWRTAHEAEELARSIGRR